MSLIYWGYYVRDMVKHELQVASYELLVTSCRLKSKSWNSKVRVQIHEFRVQTHEFKLTSYKFSFTSHEFKSTSYLKTQVNSIKYFLFSKILISLFSIYCCDYTEIFQNHVLVEMWAPPDCFVWSSPVAKQWSWHKVKEVKIFCNKYFQLGNFSFNSYVYYLTRGVIASTRVFNLLTRTFNLATRSFNPLTLGFELVTRGFEFVTRGLEIITCGF